MNGGPDFEAEGLLEGLEDKPSAKRARLELLNHLQRDGASLEELKQAVAEDRLALLPVQRAIEGFLDPDQPRLTAIEVCREAELELGFFRELWHALGFPDADPDEPRLTAQDLEAARSLRLFLGLGIPEQRILEVARVIGRAMSEVVAALFEVTREVMVQAGASEFDIAMRWGEAARNLAPQINPMLSHVLDLHRLQLLSQEVISATDLEEGGFKETRWSTICFADLVDFTALGERIGTRRLGAVALRLSGVANGVIAPPVKLVKTLGDGILLVCPDADQMIEAALEMIRVVDDDEELPSIRVGIAAGETLPRAGDWFGRPVNIASRITRHASPCEAVATRSVKQAAERGWQWESLGPHSLKGVSEEVELYRVGR